MFKIRNKVMKKWIFNNFSLIFLLLILICLVLSFATRAYYYRSAEHIVFSRLESFESSFNLKYSQHNLSQIDGTNNQIYNYSFSDSNSYYQKIATELVDSDEDKEQFEMQVLDTAGKAIISSTGLFDERDYSNEYNNAHSLPTNISVDNRKNINGERVITGILVLKNIDGSTFGAIRISSSLTKVDANIASTIATIVVVCVLILLFLLISSSYFINTMVQPINEINGVARKIAYGDYNARIARSSDDEIGELCETINFMAEEISEAEKMKNDFISSVSHELRTPLTAIKGWSETLQQAGLSDTQMTQKGLDIISGEVQRLSGIVEELLDFSQVSSGHISIKFDRVDISAELSDAVFLYEERSRREGVELIYIEPEMLSVVLGDRDRLKQVFINIIDNAVKYSVSGGKIRIETAEMGSAIQIVVSDTGEGIPRDEISKIKKKFYRVNRTRPGSGIGLALADEIIRRHKGRLDIDSEIGKGTTVSIMLPIAPPDDV